MELGGGERPEQARGRALPTPLPAAGPRSPRPHRLAVHCCPAAGMVARGVCQTMAPLSKAIVRIYPITDPRRSKPGWDIHRVSLRRPCPPGLAARALPVSPGAQPGLADGAVRMALCWSRDPGWAQQGPALGSAPSHHTPSLCGLPLAPIPRLGWCCSVLLSMRSFIGPCLPRARCPPGTAGRRPEALPEELANGQA